MAKAPAKKTTETAAKKETKKTAPVETVAKKAKSSGDAPKKTVKAKAPSDKKTAKSGKSCKVKACKREYRAKGYCKSHYREWRHGKFGKQRYTACKDMSCFRPTSINRHGFCEDHFQNYYVKGMAQAKAPVAAKAEKAPAAAPAAQAS